MKVFYSLVLGSVAFGLLVSLLLLPGRNELGLMMLKDEEYAEALETYEAQYEAGERAISVVMPLADVYLYYGDIDGALRLMEEFVAAHPQVLAARKRLGKYYLYAQRPDDYLANLEEQYAIAPNQARLREMAALYASNGNAERRLWALETLAAGDQAEPGDLLELAGLQAALRRSDDAVQTLERLNQAFPDAASTDGVELYVSLLLDDDDLDVALAQARAWLARYPEPTLAIRFAGLFENRRLAAAALSLLEPMEDLGADNPELLVALILLRIDAGQGDVAYRQMRELASRGELVERLYEPLIDMSVQRREFAYVIRLAEGLELRRLPEYILGELLDAALVLERRDFAAGMIDSLGDGFLERSPLLAAAAFLALDKPEVARGWVRRAEKVGGLQIAQEYTLADLYLRLGEDDNALALLRRLAGLAATPDVLLADLANLYIKINRAADGVDLFDTLRQKRPSPLVEGAWALVAAAAGQTEAVSRWFAVASEAAKTERLMIDLHFVALEAGHAGLALATAEGLLAIGADATRRMMLANALVLADRPAEALDHLRPLLPGDREIQSAYLGALLSARNAGAPVAGELGSYLAAQLSAPELTDQRRSEIVYTLIELKAYDEVLPVLEGLAGGDNRWFFAYVDAAVAAGRGERLVGFLERELQRPELSVEARDARLFALLEHGGPEAAIPIVGKIAYAQGGAWAGVYEGLLTDLGRRAPLLAFWRNQAARPDTPAERRRQIAYGLLEAGDKGTAEALFAELAAAAGPDSDDTLSLLYLWGPRPTPAQIAWLDGRATNASDADFPRWLDHLANAGALARVVALSATRLPPPGQGGAIFERHLSALDAIGDRTRLAALARREIAVASDAQTLERWAKFAADRSLEAEAEIAYHRLLDRSGDSAAARRYLGLRAAALRHNAEAVDHLAAYHAAANGDWLSRLAHAESLAALRREAEARPHYEAALASIEAAARPSAAMLSGKAQILARLGRVEEALALYETLRQDRPGDTELAAEHASLLLDNRRYDAARTILSQP